MTHTLAIAIVVAAALFGLAAVAVQALTVRAYVRSLENDRDYLRARLTDVERQARAHHWQEYAGLTQLATPLQQANEATAVRTNGWGETRPEEAFGETEEDVIAAYFEQHGVDLESPTLG